MSLENPEPQVVYGVYSQQDMTEGRGPMVLDKLFTTEDEAWKYADTMPGVMGCKPQSGSWRTEKYNGQITVKSLFLFANKDQASKTEEEKAKQAALAKLSPVERKLLGLQ